jgi:hypothetical protein
MFCIDLTLGWEPNNQNKTKKKLTKICTKVINNDVNKKGIGKRQSGLE